MQGISPAVIKRAISLDGSYGHEIWGIKAFLKAGLPEEFLLPLVDEVESGPVGTKYGLTDNENNPVDSLIGIYGLRLLRALADELEVEYNGGFMGRGFQAQAIQSALNVWVESQPHFDETQPYEGAK